MCAPLRTGQRTVGVIALANSSAESSYSAADLKLLNTIALQTAAAIENSLFCAEMVETARERAAFAAELQAASTLQQLLLQSASRPTPGFQVDSVYLPASEVGGDFFFVSPAPDGSLTAIVGDVPGKGLPAAMRVAMILGALRRETSHDPGDILSALNCTDRAWAARIYHGLLCSHLTLRRICHRECRTYFCLYFRSRSEHAAGVAAGSACGTDISAGARPAGRLGTSRPAFGWCPGSARS